MKYTIYNRENKYIIYALSIYYSLRQLGYAIDITSEINEQDDDTVYIIVGGEFIIDIPKHYIVIQILSTSSLTLTDKIEAYWMTDDYIRLLRNSIEIWDFYRENIKVWETFYGFKNVKYIPFGYNHFICEKVIKNNKVITNQTATIIGSDRAKKLYDNICKKSNLVSGYYSNTEPFNVINTLIKNNSIAIIINDHPQSLPDIAFIYALLYNGITVIVESSQYTTVNLNLTNLGCKVVQLNRLEKKTNQTIYPFINTKSVCLVKQNMSLLLPKCFYKNIPKQIDGLDKKACRRHLKKITDNLYIRDGTKDVDYKLLEDGGISLSIGDVTDELLTSITILTPTANRRGLFPLAIRNFMLFNYPKHLVKWIILDNGDQSIKDIIPNDNRVEYTYIDPKKEKKLNVSEMRNKLVEMSNTNIVLFMDDDDYYPPESLIARVKCLIKYKDIGIKCVGCRDIASYDLMEGICAICNNGKDYLCEASLAFYRDFWEMRHFRHTDSTNEARYFIEGRQHLIRSIPFQYITVAFTHGTNTTGNVRSLAFQRRVERNTDWEATKKSILSILDDDTQSFIQELKKSL